MRKLNKTEVEKLEIPKAGQKLYFGWDGMPTGFGLRVTQGGSRSYFLEKRIEGKTRRITLGKHGDITPHQAKIKTAEELLLVFEGTTSIAEKKRNENLNVTLLEVAKAYVKERRTKKGGELAERTKHDILLHVEKSFSDWANRPIVNITRDKCSAQFIALSARGKTQANIAFRYLRALLSYAREAYRQGDQPILLENPVDVISGKKMWNPNNAKNGRIPLDKIGAVWNQLQSKRYSDVMTDSAKTGADIVLMLMLTGARWGEAAELRWQDLNLENGSWHIADPKNHNPVTFPITAPLRAILEYRTRIDENPYVFYNRNKSGFITNARTSLIGVGKISGLHITAHDLRRTFIAIGIHLKIEMWKLKLLTNHISKGDVTIDHYTETSDLRYLAPEAEKIAAWIVDQGKIAAEKEEVKA